MQAEKRSSYTTISYTISFRLHIAFAHLLTYSTIRMKQKTKTNLQHKKIHEKKSIEPKIAVAKG